MRSRLPILLLFACALFLRAWVPAGWMPAAQGHAFAIELCPSAGPGVAAQHWSHNHGKHAPGSHGGQDGDCSFAPLSAAAAYTDGQPIASIVVKVAEAPLQSPPAPFFATGPPALPPPSTGPPALA